MITKEDIKESLQFCEDFLGEIKLIEETTYRLRQERKAFSRDPGDNKRSHHAACLIARDYDFLLKDRSFFQFSIYCERNTKTKRDEVHKVVFSFIQNTKTFPTIEYFIKNEEKGIDEFDFDMRDLEAEEKSSFAYIRYEYDSDPNIFREILHPTSHFHIGEYNDIRIACKKFLSPLSFVYYIVQLVYPAIWGEFYCKNENNKSRLKNNKEKDLDIIEERFTQVEKKFYHLA